MHRRDLLKAVLGVMGATALLPHVPAPALPLAPVLPSVPAYRFTSTSDGSDSWPTWYIEGLDVHGNSLGLVEMQHVTGDVSPILSKYSRVGHP